MMRKTLRTLAVTAVAAGALVTLPGIASAGEGGYVSGYEGAGMIMMTSTHPGDDCATRRAFLVLHDDNPELPAALRSDSGPGSGWVCVSKAAFGNYHVGKWWSGRASGPRG